MFEYIHKFVKNISFTIDKQLTEEYTWKQLKQDDFYTREDIDMTKEVKQAVAEPEVNTAEWLEQKIDEDLDAWAEERMKMLMESEELQDIHMPEDSLEKLHQKINARKKKLLGRKRIHMLVAAAAVMTALLGVGLRGAPY